MNSYRDYYTKHVKINIQSESGDELHVFCPFHEDKKQSMSVNMVTGVWNCFGACGEGGSVEKFHAKYFKMDIKLAKEEIKKLLGISSFIPPSLIDQQHKVLLANKVTLAWLKKERGLPLAIVKKFKLGYEKGRICIPILDGEGNYVNIRKYLPKAGDKQNKIISYSTGYGSARLFPQSTFTKSTIFLCEGEMDCLLANSVGYNAVTVTGGAETFNETFVPLFKDKIVIICYDIDDKGKKGSQKAARYLQGVAKELKIIRLPITTPKNGDFTDYILKHNGTKHALDELIQQTVVFSSTSEKQIDEKVYETSLTQASNKKHYFKKIKMNVVVSGKDLAPYFAPKKIILRCNAGQKKCEFCGLGNRGGQSEIVFDNLSHELLQMIKCNEESQRHVAAGRANINNCTSFTMEIEEVHNVEELRVIPEIDYSPKDTEYVTRNIYCIAHGIKTNKSYTMEGITVPEPRTQYVTQIISKVEPNEIAFDNFKMNPDTYKKLSIFQPGGPNLAAVEKKLRELYQDLSYNVTKIYERQDLLTAIDLVYHSVIRFNFLGSPVTKGWTEALLIGDTRSGKSDSANKILTHYRAGELITAENLSYAGLVGGMQQVQQRWSISWGKIPLNDRRLIILDETSGMACETIANLSGIRSSGVAEITKIQCEKTNARTRLLWLSNPRSGRKLDTYNHGVEAIRSLIGKVEDIARFDLAVTSASGEVDINKINSYITKKIKHSYTSALCHNLISWAWSRRPDQVVFSKGSEELILDRATKLGQLYSSNIPLVEPAEQRIKLARLSVALAARLFSTDKSGEQIIVQKCHVEYLFKYMTQIFNKPSMEYDLFSKNVMKGTTLSEQDINSLQAEFVSFPDWEVIRDLLLEYSIFKRSEFVDQSGCDAETHRRFFKWASANRLIKTSSRGYFKTPAFTSFLKGLKAGKTKEVKF